MNQVLKLNADYSAIGIVPWSEAVELILGNKASAVENVEGKFVRSERLAMPWPAVIALKRYKQVRSRVKFSGKNVILRDMGRCNYCGCMPRLNDGRIDRKELTLDHVVPRAAAQSGAVFLPWSKKWVNVTSWENATTACGGPSGCNARKGNRTPEQAGMRLLSIPRTPTQADVLRMNLSNLREIPAAWAAYLPTVPGLGETTHPRQTNRAGVVLRLSTG